MTHIFAIVYVERDVYRPYKKSNDLLSNINRSSNHPPKITNQLPTTINEGLPRNSSNEEAFNSSKHQYEASNSNKSLIKPVPTKQKEIGSVALFGLIRLSTE